MCNSPYKSKENQDGRTEKKLREREREKYRGVFEIQKSGDKTSSGEICLDIRTHASPKVGQDQVSGGVSVPCRHATPVADALWKPISGEMSDHTDRLFFYISTKL